MYRRLAPARLFVHASALAAFGLGLYAAPAWAACPTEDFSVLCNSAVIGDGPRLTQADVDGGAAILTTDAWVLDGTTTINLPAGDYAPGVAANLGSPTIFVTEDASLILEDVGAMGVDVNANIILCDSATLEVRDSELRFGSEAGLTLALDDSDVVLAGATLSGLGGGAITQVFDDTASLTATPTALPSISSGAGSIQWSFGGASTAIIDQAQLFATLGIGATASVSLSDSSYVEVLMESCEGDTLTVDAFPEACDLTSECFTGDHPLTNFVRPAPFAVELVDSSVFAWRVTSHPGSTTTLGGTPAHANLAVDLTGDFGVSALTFPPGEEPEGLSDRTLSVSDPDAIAWVVSALGMSDLSIGAGSELSGLTCSDDAVCFIEGTSFVENAVVDNFGSAELSAVDVTFGGAIRNLGASMELSSCTLDSDLIMAAPTWLAETNAPFPSTVEGGVFHVVELSTPVDGMTLEPGETLEISGSAFATDLQGPLRPFPPALVELYNLQSRETTLVATVEATAEDAVLYTWDTTGVDPGVYEVSLRFETSQVAVVRRRVTISAESSGSSTGEGSSSGSGAETGDGDTATSSGGADTTTGGADPTASTTGDPTGASEGDSTGGGTDADSAGEKAGDGGCSAHPSPPSAWAWLILGLGLVRRRRHGVQPVTAAPDPSQPA